MEIDGTIDVASLQRRVEVLSQKSSDAWAQHRTGEFESQINKQSAQETFRPVVEALTRLAESGRVQVRAIRLDSDVEAAKKSARQRGYHYEPGRQDVSLCDRGPQPLPLPKVGSVSYQITVLQVRDNDSSSPRARAVRLWATSDRKLFGEVSPADYNTGESHPIPFNTAQDLLDWFFDRIGPELAVVDQSPAVKAL